MMKTALIFIAVFLVVCSPTQLTEAEVEDPTPKLPVYLAVGYNILKGNPLSNTVDTGFSSPIYKFTYDEGKVTDDNKYLIPDGVTTRVASSCSFSSEVSEHRGTSSYKKEIATKITVKVGASTTIQEASFSVSTSYDDVQRQTMQNKMSLTHASADCEAYYVSVDLFRNYTFEPSFINAVKMSFESNDWNDFIKVYGTHFVREVTMGGRALQEISYSYEAVSILSSLNIDISTTAKFRFAMFFADTTVDWHKYEEQLAYSQKFTNHSSELYIGAQPPRNGDIRQWAAEVINNPMPIRYSVVELTDIFDKIDDSYIKQNLPQIKTSFVEGMFHYCLRVGCKAPSRDRAKPPTAKIQTFRTESVGQKGGGDFEWFLPEPLININKFLVSHSGNINVIQVIMSDEVKSKSSPEYGLHRGQHQDSWEVPKNEYISQVEYINGDYWLLGFNLITNKGTKSPRFGSNSGQYKIVTFPVGYRVIGIYGRCGDYVDALGFVLGKTVIPYSQQYGSIQQKVDSMPEIIRVELK